MLKRMMMKRLTILFTLLVLVALSGCEQINPQADTTATGANVQVTEGGPAGEEDENNEEDDDDE